MNFSQYSVRVRRDNVSLAAAVTFFTSLYFYLPVMTVYLVSRGLNIFQISVMHGVILGAQSLAEIPTGLLADRWGRKTAWVLAVTFQFIGEAWFFFAHTYVEYLAIAVIGGIGFAFGSGALEALIYDTLPEEDRERRMQKALGWISAMGRIGNVAAYLASGWLLREVSAERFGLTIGLTAGAVGLGALLTLLAVEPERLKELPTDEHNESGNAKENDARKDRFWRELRVYLDTLFKALHSLAGDRELLRLAFLFIFSDPFGFYLISLSQLLFVRAQLPAAWFGPMIALGSLFAAYGERSAYRVSDGLGVRRAILVTCALPGLFYMLIAPIRQPAAVILVFLGLYASLFISRPLLRAAMNGHIAAESRATTLSMIQLVGSLYLAGMGVWFGWIGDRSVTGLFISMGIVILAAALSLGAIITHSNIPDS